MKLYDHRMVERGAVLSYRGDIGLNDNIQHAVDPSEKFVVSGNSLNGYAIFSCYLNLVFKKYLFYDYINENRWNRW